MAVENVSVFLSSGLDERRGVADSRSQVLRMLPALHGDLVPCRFVLLAGRQDGFVVGGSCAAYWIDVLSAPVH